MRTLLRVDAKTSTYMINLILTHPDKISVISAIRPGRISFQITGKESNTTVLFVITKWSDTPHVDSYDLEQVVLRVEPLEDSSVLKIFPHEGHTAGPEIPDTLTSHLKTIYDRLFAGLNHGIETTITQAFTTE